MANLTRRDFIKNSSLIGVSACLPLSYFSRFRKDRRLFKMSLNPGAIGVEINQDQLLDVAIRYSFEAIPPLLNDLSAKSIEVSISFYDRMKSQDISWDALSLPVEFRKDETTFQDDLKKLSQNGVLLERLDISRCSTWIMPTHEKLSYLENFKLHAKRLKSVADVLSDHDIKLGIEYVGPKTLMAWKKHPFIGSMQEARELIAETKSDNIGIQLDSFHWYCAEETIDDLRSLKPDEIITCDLNDAVKGRSVNEQLDYERELPGVSGEIDLKAFLEVLIDIKYDGPVRAEPFNARLNAMNDTEAIMLTKKQMQATFDLIK